MNARSIAITCLISSLGWACKTAVPSTNIAVVVDADTELRAHIDRVVVRVLGGKNLDDERLATSLTIGDGLVWPFGVAVSPLEGDASRRFEVTATAYQEETAIGRVKAICGFVVHETRALHLRFERACEGKLCESDTTCHAGDCTDALVSAQRLPRFDAFPHGTSPKLLHAPDAGISPDSGDTPPLNGSGGHRGTDVVPTTGDSDKKVDGSGGAASTSIGGGQGHEPETTTHGDSGTPDAEVDAGAACTFGKLCVTLSPPSELDPSSIRKLVLAVYPGSAPPAPTLTGMPAPDAVYTAVSTAKLDAPYEFRQAFTSPIAGDYSGTHYVAVIAMTSDSGDAVPNRDYWYVHPEPLTLGETVIADLGAHALSGIAAADDPSTPGHDGRARIACGSGTACADQVCCIFTATVDICGAIDDCGHQGYDSCDGPEDCESGQVCCVVPDPTATYAHCAAQADCVAPEERPMCHTNADCGELEVCANGRCIVDRSDTSGDDRPGFVMCSNYVPNGVPNASADRQSCDGTCCIGSDLCVAAGESCGSADDFRCDGPEDCPGQVCCRGNTNSRCSMASDCPIAKPGTGLTSQVCHSDADCLAGNATCTLNYTENSFMHGCYAAN